MKRKFFVLTLVLVLVFCMALPVFAEDDVESPPKTLEEQAEIWANSGCKVSVVYTYDSIRKDGVYAEPYVDILTQTFGAQITTDLDFGICIYDDPETEEIDGLRVNGAPVTSLKIPMTGDPTDINIAVRLYYKEGVAGDLARISDGTFDWTILLSNPLVLLGALYYAIASITAVVASIAALKSKSKQVKSANEIASAVEERATESVSRLQDIMVAYLDEQVAPVLQRVVGSTQHLVKAMAISTSKSKDAPVAILDTLQEVCDLDATNIIEQAKKSVLEADAKVLAHKTQVMQALNAMQTPEYREVQNELAAQSKESSDTGAETKSVF